MTFTASTTSTAWWAPRRRRSGLALVRATQTRDRAGPRPGRGRGARADVGSRLRMSARPPDRNLALELVRVTEAAALAAGRWVGRGDKIAADQAAVDGMRAMLDSVSMAGVVVIGEGEKDEAPMLFNGEPVGDGTGPRSRRRGGSARGNAVDGARPAECDRGHRRRGARHDVLPRRRRLHEQDRGRAAGHRRRRYQRVADGERQRASRRRRECRHGRSPSSCSSVSVMRR